MEFSHLYSATYSYSPNDNPTNEHNAKPNNERDIFKSSILLLQTSLVNLCANIGRGDALVRIAILLENNLGSVTPEVHPHLSLNTVSLLCF